MSAAPADVELQAGQPWPLGAHWDGHGVNFAVFSAHAQRIELCLFDADGQRVRCDLSCTVFLNDPDDYEGGELYFDKFNLKIKPKAGDLYLFPSSYLFSHAAMPVTDGIKYSIVTMLDYIEAAHTPEYRKIEKNYLIKNV